MALWFVVLSHVQGYVPAPTLRFPTLSDSGFSQLLCSFGRHAGLQIFQTRAIVMKRGYNTSDLPGNYHDGQQLDSSRAAISVLLMTSQW